MENKDVSKFMNSKKGLLETKLVEKPSLDELKTFFAENNDLLKSQDGIFLTKGKNLDKRFKKLEDAGLKLNTKSALCLINLDFSEGKSAAQLNFLDMALENIKNNNVEIGKKIFVSVYLSKIYQLDKKQKQGNIECKFYENILEMFFEKFDVTDYNRNKNLYQTYSKVNSDFLLTSTR